MVDFDAAVAAVQDPNADPAFLARIAYENPEFGANVVANPRAYPGLKQWIAQFGDERARQQLIAMGWPVPPSGVQQRMAAEPVAQQPVMQQPAVEPSAAQQPAMSGSTSEYQAAEAYNADPAFNAANTHATAPAQETGYAAQSQSADDTEGQPVAAAQETSAAADTTAPANGYTAELAMQTTDQMLMAHIAGEAPELRPALARNPNIYPELLQWLGQLNDSAINAAIRSRQ
ncbi:MAG: hypothetical protein PUB74_03485 [Bifidobacterium boum]|nr:hypothetical protein [Bifidobacterium boum]